MKRKIFFCIALVSFMASLTACNSSKRCGCPTFGQIENTQAEWACVVNPNVDLH